MLLKEVQAISSALEGKISVNVPELHEIPNLTLPDQCSLSLIKHHWPLWPKHKPKILYWDWSFNMCIRGKH